MTASDSAPTARESGFTLSLGRRLYSSVCTTEVVVIKLPDRPVALTCGEQPMSATLVPGAVPAAGGGPDVTLVGKRYVDAVTGLELLCVKSGVGGLGADDRQFSLKAANALPASD